MSVWWKILMWCKYFFILLRNIKHAHMITVCNSVCVGVIVGCSVCVCVMALVDNKDEQERLAWIHYILHVVLWKPDMFQGTSRLRFKSNITPALVERTWYESMRLEVLLISHTLRTWPVPFFCPLLTTFQFDATSFFDAMDKTPEAPSCLQVREFCFFIVFNLCGVNLWWWIAAF